MLAAAPWDHADPHRTALRSPARLRGLGRLLLAGAVLSVVASARSQGPPAKAYARGSVHYRVSFPYNPEGETHEERLTWDETAVRADSRWPRVSSSDVYFGKDILVFMAGQHTVRFTRETTPEYPGNPKYGLVARRPSMALGGPVAGFPVVRREGGRIAEASDSARAAPFTRWTYEGTMPAGTGIVPHVATQVTNGRRETTQRFEILGAEIGRLPEGERIVPDWYRSDMEIADDRVYPPVGWKYEELVAASGKKTDLTPDELLVFSRQRAGQIGKSLEARRLREVGQRSTAMSVWVVPLVVFAGVLGIGGLVMLVRRRSAAG